MVKTSTKAHLKTPRTPKRKSMNQNANDFSAKHRELITPSSTKKRQRESIEFKKIDVDNDVIGHKTPKSVKKLKENITPTLLTPKTARKSKENASVSSKKKKNSTNYLEFASSKISDLKLNKTPKSVNKSLKLANKTPKSIEKTPKVSNKTPKSIEKTPKVTNKTPKSIENSPKLTRATLKTPKVTNETPEPIAKTPKSTKANKTPKSKKKVKTVDLTQEDITKIKLIRTPKQIKQGNVDNKPDFTELESKYNVKASDVKNAVEGVIKLVEGNPKLRNKLFNEQFPLFLQVSCFKVPKGYHKIFRIPVSHSILTPDDDVCLIVPDVKGIKNVEHEQHEQHYEELLRKKGVNGIKKIMTFHEFRTEYETFELKNRLVDLYDLFLVDAKISGKVVQKGGKIFYSKRKVPTPVKLHVTNLKKHIEDNMRKAYFHLNLKSDNYCLQFGHNKMKVKDLVENVFNIVEYLGKNFPGGFKNIRNLHILAPRASSIPIYISMEHPYNLKVPVLKTKKPKSIKTEKGELSTVLGATVAVTPSGTVRKVKKEPAEKSPSEEKNESDSLNEENTEKNTKDKVTKKRKMDEDTTVEPKTKKMSKNNKSVKIIKKVKSKKNK